MSAFLEQNALFFGVMLLIALLALLIHWRVSIVETRGRLSRLELKLDLLLKLAGVEHDPYKGLPQDVVEALQRGQKIQAIQRYRKANAGVGLKDAKLLIEGVQQRAGDG